MKNLIFSLETEIKRCSDCGLTNEYRKLLQTLNGVKLNKEIVEFLCDKIVSKKFIWEIRLEHLSILLKNDSTKDFDLKLFFLENVQKTRSLTMKLFFIRGFAIYATETELIPIVDKFKKYLLKNHDYIDYEHILSAAGLPYLVNHYNYQVFIDVLKIAEEEYQKIDPLLRGYFTINENFEQINRIDPQEAMLRSRKFVDNYKMKKEL